MLFRSLPKAPQGAYAVDGKPVSRWRMVAISTTKDAVLGDCEYSLALEKLAPYILDAKDDSVLVRGLSLSELETIPE